MKDQVVGWTGQQDRFIHDRLPANDDWPVFLLPSHLQGQFRLNCVDLLIKPHIDAGRGSAIALRSDCQTLSYQQLYDRVGKLTGLLQGDFALGSGQRVLLRGTNSPDLVCFWLAIQMCGAVPVTTLSLLRAGELTTIIEMSRPCLVICEASLTSEIDKVKSIGGSEPGDSFRQLVYGGEPGKALQQRLESVAAVTESWPTRSDDIALIGFTSGTTGRPKATVHFHRDVVAVCETIANGVIKAKPDDIFIGTAPLAFTFGLGGLLLFPLFAGASVVLNPRYDPDLLLDAIHQHQATVCFTVPTFYQRMARSGRSAEVSSLRLAICSGEALPMRVREAWMQFHPLPLTEFFGSTEMLHAFAGGTGEVPDGAIGLAFDGYEAAILDESGMPLPARQTGRFAIRGPTGCRYLDDPRQSGYVQNGWNITGDTCYMDEHGFVYYVARSDDMIISSGYNIAGIEVEDVLLRHPAVAECAVIGEADPDRGAVVAAYIVPRNPVEDPGVLKEQLQQHVKSSLAPYKYPRVVRFIDALPRNESGKVQRFRLRQQQ